MKIQWLNFGRTLVVGILFGLWCAVLGGAIGFWLGEPALYPVNVFAGLISIGLFVLLTHRWFNHKWLGVICLLNIGTLIGTGIGTSQERLYYGQVQIDNIQAEQISQHPEAMIFTLEQAVVQREYGVTFSYTTSDARRSSTTSYAISIAPLTSPDWQPDQPVPAWAVCGGYFEYQCEEWKQPIKAALISKPTNQNPQQTAITKNLDTHGYTAIENAPRLYVGSSVESLMADHRFIWRSTWLFVNGIWAVPFFIFVGAELLWNTLKQLFTKKPS